MLEDDDLIIVRGGRMATESLRGALLDSAERGLFELSTHFLPKGDLAALSEVWDFWLERYPNAACWTTPGILREAGLVPVHTPSDERGPFHVDVRHPANPRPLEMVVRPGLIMGWV